MGSYELQVMIFFSAHGVPLAYVEEAGDPYKAEMEECVDLIMEELEKRQIMNGYTLAYQVYDLIDYILCFSPVASALLYHKHNLMYWKLAFCESERVLAL